jgi:hypothetical protein
LPGGGLGATGNQPALKLRLAKQATGIRRQAMGLCLFLKFKILHIIDSAGFEVSE